MERVIIQIPEKKSKLVRSLLKELGVVIEPDLHQLSQKLKKMVKDGPELTMDEIVAETRAARASLK